MSDPAADPASELLSRERAARAEALLEKLAPKKRAVLVLHDMLGVYPGRKARFVKNFMDGRAGITEAVAAYVAAVKDGSFPAPEHCD